MVKKKFFVVCFIFILITSLAYAKDEKKQAATKTQISANQINVPKTDYVVEKLVLRTDDIRSRSRRIFWEGKTLYADCHWKRNGLTSKYGIWVKLYVDDVSIGSKGYGSVDSSDKISRSWKMVAGKHNVKCVLEASSVDDDDPNNNQKVTGITVQKRKFVLLNPIDLEGFMKPDLEVAEVGVKVGGQIYYQKYKQIKKGATLVIVCNWNNKTSEVTDKDWWAQLAPSPYNIPKVYKVDKGMNSGTVFSVPIKFTSKGMKKLECKLDMGNKIQEQSESNNYGSLMINIIE
jgi:hypothetical protein